MNATTTNEHAGEIMKLQRILKVLREELGDIAITEAQVFLEVAANEGASQIEFRKNLNMSKASVSRFLISLGQLKRTREQTPREVPGSNLVEQSIDLHERRRRKCTLTPKGRQVLRKLARIIK